MSSALQAAAWGYAGTIGKLLIQFGAQIVIARILGPDDYGQFAIGALTISLSSYIAEAGIGSAIVQRKNLDAQTINFIFSLQALIGLFMSLLIWIGAGLLGHYLDSDPQAILVVQIMGLACVLNAAASTPNNLLRRALDYKHLQFCQLAGFSTGYLAIGVPLAVAGCGIWSLVAAWLVQSSVGLLTVWAIAKPDVQFLFNHPDRTTILRFGKHATLSNIANWGNGNGDKLVIAHGFPIAQLGIYNAASNLLSTLITQILSTLQSVIFSATARSSEDPAVVTKTYLTLLEAGCFLMMPLFVCIGGFDDALLQGIYGPQWTDSGALITPLATGIAAYGVTGLLTPLLWSNGQIDKESRLQLLSASLMMVVVAGTAALSHDVVATAWAACAGLWARLILISYSIAQWLGVSPKRVALFIGCGVSASGLAQGLVIQARQSLESRDMTGAALLAGLILVAILVTMLVCSVLTLIGPEGHLRHIAIRISTRARPSK
ncbi:oligosaccharide flippase family protein [Sphaerotilus sulfidivorans]|uniref:oligosaccharide flippase family protein n=1 Tax=Sphaerotilus sp. FB-3 TaxID=2913396 RepID=UPI0021755B67|nr:oligosaccharide flippase family protein [Sphaerotilus sp. FB-3]